MEENKATLKDSRWSRGARLPHLQGMKNKDITNQLPGATERR